MSPRARSVVWMGIAGDVTTPPGPLEWIHGSGAAA
jgi:hypothetical protein